MTAQNHLPMLQDPAARIFGLFSFSTVMRHRALIVLCVLFAVSLGAAVGLTRTPSYTSSARILIENRQLQVTNQQDVVLAETYMDAARVQNQIEVLRSEDLLRRLYERVRPVETAPGLRERLIGLLPLPKAGAAEGDESALALDSLRDGLMIGRVGNSHVIDIRYTSNDAAFANRVVSELVEIYLTQAAQRAGDAAQIASPWLRDRLTAIGANAVVITAAQPARRPDGPGLLRIVALSIILGSLTGGGIAFLCEYRDQHVRTCADAATTAGVPCLGAIPRGGVEKEILGRVAVRRIRTVIGAGITGVASATSGEGAEDLARDLAALLRTEMPDTVLVRIGQGMNEDSPCNFSIDPSSLSQAALDTYLVDLRARHSHVVVAYPPLIPGLEVEAMRDRLDHLVMVVAWGHATQDLLAETATRAPKALRGVVLTQVDLRRLRHYSATEHRLIRSTLAQSRIVAA